MGMDEPVSRRQSLSTIAQSLSKLTLSPYQFRGFSNTAANSHLFLEPRRKMQSSAFFRAVVPTAQFRGISSRASKALTPSSISTPNGVSSYGLSELAPVVKLRDFSSAVAKPGVDDGGYTGVTSNKTELGMLVPKNEMKIGRDRDRDRSGREVGRC